MEELKKADLPASEEDLIEVLGPEFAEEIHIETESVDDSLFVPIQQSIKCDNDISGRSTRSGISSSQASDSKSFPQVPVRTGPKTLNVDLMSVLVQGVSKFGFSPHSALEYTKMLANEVFGQSYETAGPELENMENNVDEEESNSLEEPPQKKLKPTQDLTFVLPTRQTITNWSRDGYILNFKLVAEKVVEAKSNGAVVVLGLDDSLKADGNKKYDVKTGHVSVIDEQKKRTTYSTGFTHNISHSGKDQAENVQHTLAMMAVLAATTPEEVKSAIDFFIMDRAADGKVMLDELGRK